MSSSIKLCPVHGLNPSMMQCFLCGETFGIALPGKLRGCKQAPTMHSDPSYVCDTCKEWMKQGIILISARDGETDEKNPYRTGGWIVLREEALHRFPMNPDLIEAICRKRVAFLEDAVWDGLGLPRGKVTEGIPRLRRNH